MDETLSCSVCHQPVKATDYFCPNCGKNLHPRPLTTSLSGQIFLYIKTILLPPFGFIWGYRYLRQPDNKSKIIGFVIVAITIIEIIWIVKTTIYTMNNVNQQINQQLELYGL